MSEPICPECSAPYNPAIGLSHRIGCSQYAEWAAALERLYKGKTTEQMDLEYEHVFLRGEAPPPVPLNIRGDE